MSWGSLQTGPQASRRVFRSGLSVVGQPVQSAPRPFQIQAAANPGRVGGVLGLARILGRASKDLVWNDVVSLAAEHPNGRPALRRLATLIEILGIDVPRILERAAHARPGESPLFLADRRTHGAQGARNQDWQVIVNIDPASIEDELRR